jgi:hypothetical protein
MTNAQQSMTDLQAHALEAIQSGQAAAVEALQIWSQAVAKLTPEVPSAPAVPNLKDTIGDPAVIVDSVYDFAKELIDLNKAFVHQMLEASQTTTDKVTTKPPAKAASKA